MSKHEMKKDKNTNHKKLKIGRILFLIAIICFAILNYKFEIISKVALIIRPILINKIDISVEKIELELGESVNIEKKIFPENYSKSNLVWYNSNEDVIELQGEKIIAKNVGKSVIYLSDEENIKSNEIEIECLVKPKDVSIDNLISQIRLGDIYKLEAKVVPENATYTILQYETSNPEILTVNDDGNLIANSIGNATISIKDYKGNLLKEFEIEVTKIPVEKITLDDKEVTLGKGQTYILNAKVEPVEATYTDIEWESSDTSVIKIEDRKITAIGTGTAKITAITDNGDKKESCSFTVTKENPQNKIKYANGKYNIRTGGSTDYKVLATTSKYEEIEILQDTKPGWKKVRNSKGVVGYTQIKEGYYLDEKPAPVVNDSSDTPVEEIVTSYHISKVPYINQFSLGYPTGCEAVSATMVLRYKGYDVSTKDIIKNTKTGSKKYQGADGLWYGANPFEEFVGDPSLGLGKGSYGVFAKPIADAMAVYAAGKVTNISGCSENELFNQVSKGNPVVVWCVKNAGNLKEGVTWNYEGGTFKELVGEHCAVLIGYDEDYVYLNDPSAGENVKQSKSKFISNWKQLFSQAIVVK